jgi:hypothetical protein
MVMKKHRAILFFSIFILAIIPFISTVQAAVPPPDWTIQLTSTINSYSSSAVFGVSSNAINGWDPNYDGAQPSSITGVSCYFYVSTNSPSFLRSLSTSIISSGDTWIFRVQSVDQDGTMTITWSDLTSLASGFNIFLEDSTGKQLVNLRTSTNYQFSADSGTTYSFKIQIVPAFPLPEYPLGAALALGACFAAFTVYKKRGSLPKFSMRTN